MKTLNTENATENLTPTQIFETVDYNFEIVHFETETVIAEIITTTENAAKLASVLQTPKFEIRPAIHHTRFADKLQFWGWSVSDIAENLGPNLG